MKFFEWLEKVAGILAYVAELTPTTADEKIISEAREAARYISATFGRPVWKKEVDANQVKDAW